MKTWRAIFEMFDMLLSISPSLSRSFMFENERIPKNNIHKTKTTMVKMAMRETVFVLSLPATLVPLVKPSG